MLYVSEASAKKARSYATKFQKLPANAGIIFVSVAAVPTEGGMTSVFDIVLGVSRGFDPSLGISIVKKVLESEIKAGISLREVTSIIGVSGAACDRGDESDARPH